MIIVTGSIQARPDTQTELLRLCLEHVARSRTEEGCLSHAVHQDAENPLRLVFVEEWRDRQSLVLHFAQPASREFVRNASQLAASSPTISIYEATPLPFSELSA